MTITNHIRRIEDLAEQVIGFVDTREYHMAHSALCDIEKRARLAHEHLDHLQDVLPLEQVIADDPDSWITDNISKLQVETIT